MIDLRPVGYVIGLLIAAMGAMMLLPMAVDWIAGNQNAFAFAKSALLSGVVGGAMALACANGRGTGIGLRQSFLLTTGVWVFLPMAGALPFMLGAPGAGVTDAYFESVSGMTTTGTTVFVGLDALPAGTNLWRAMLQWLGGLGILLVAMIFLPIMKVGGMQFFRTEGFETLGKILPRAFDISMALIRVYLILTLACIVTFRMLGMPAFDAAAYGLSAISTGGFAPKDASFAPYAGVLELAAAVFMILASLPFIRFVQVAQGQVTPLWRDTQVRAYLRWIAYATLAVAAYEVSARDAPICADAARGVLQCGLDLFGDGFHQCRPVALGAVFLRDPDCGRVDRGMHLIDRLFDQGVPLPDPVRGDPRPDPPPAPAPCDQPAALRGAAGGGRDRGFGDPVLHAVHGDVRPAWSWRCR